MLNLNSMLFLFQIKEPVVKEIKNKETEIAFDKVDVPIFVGFFEEENEGKIILLCINYWVEILIGIHNIPSTDNGGRFNRQTYSTTPNYTRV